MFFAIGPDLDFLPGLLRGTPALFHQGISHSLCFAFAAGLIGAGLFRMMGWSALSGFLLASCAWASHLLLDLFGPDKRPPYGIPLFWPLSDRPFLSPVAFLPGVHHVRNTDASNLEWLRGIFDWYNLRALITEALVVGPFVPLAMWLNWWKRKKRIGSRGK
jgi:inner membrane protein